VIQAHHLGPAIVPAPSSASSGESARIRLLGALESFAEAFDARSRRSPDVVALDLAWLVLADRRDVFRGLLAGVLEAARLRVDVQVLAEQVLSFGRGDEELLEGEGERLGHAVNALQARLRAA
jgi:hypothetical protein